MEPLDEPCPKLGATIGIAKGTIKTGNQFSSRYQRPVMRKLSALLVVLAVAGISASARAQTGSVIPQDADTAAPKQVQPTPEQALDNLQKAAEDLSKAVEVAAAKIVNNPEIQVAALQVAAGAVSLAHQSLADQLKMIEAALNAAARHIAAAQSSIAKKQE